MTEEIYKLLKGRYQPTEAIRAIAKLSSQIFYNYLKDLENQGRVRIIKRKGQYWVRRISKKWK